MENTNLQLSLLASQTFTTERRLVFRGGGGPEVQQSQGKEISSNNERNDIQKKEIKERIKLLDDVNSTKPKVESQNDPEVIRYKTALDKLLKKQGYQLTAIAAFDKDPLNGIISIAVKKGNSIEVPLNPNLSFSADDLESLLAKFNNQDEWSPGLDDYSIRALVNLGLIEKINTEDK